MVALAVTPLAEVRVTLPIRALTEGLSPADMVSVTSPFPSVAERVIQSADFVAVQDWLVDSVSVSDPPFEVKWKALAERSNHVPV